MPHLFLVIFNVLLVCFFVYLFFKKNLLGYFGRGQWWLTWLAIGSITLMDELTSIFYAPGEAFRYLGIAAIFFIPVTAVIIHTMTTRMVEIAEILDVNKLRGGGVYNFSYLVLGPVVSFVAVASIMVDYVLTAAISTVSAVENASYFLNIGTADKIFIEIGLVWLLAGLNILGIRNNARITFAIVLITAVVLLNLLISGFFHVTPENVQITLEGARQSVSSLKGGFFSGYAFFIAGISSCILAYSGVESVMQTASLVQNWKVVAKAYIFLAVTVGLFTPLLSVLVLSSPGIDFALHETDLITHFATQINGPSFGMTVSVIASITLLMAMNTAYVAASELLERVAHRYGFGWVVKTNRFASLYRIHIASAVFFSVIIVFTQGQQMQLASMYAIGLIASFLINLGSLLIYRYSKGTQEVPAFNVSRTGTLVFFVIILSSFVFLSYHKPAGFFLWLGVAVFSLLIGIYGTRKRAPEVVQMVKGENPMDIVFFISESPSENVNVYFKRPFDTPQEKMYGVPVFVTFYSPRQDIPPRAGDNHFRIPFKRASVLKNIEAILNLLAYELKGKNITVHFGWPTSSWFDRLSTGVMVFQFIRLPRKFPQINFKIEGFKSGK
ncbi:MAG: APC family permease [Deltaproteobacteria bacterium]|nr:APC family permease [Deltaproteobacteria bacterium]